MKKYDTIGPSYDTEIGLLRPDEYGYLAGYAAGYAAFKPGGLSYLSKTLSAGLAIGAYDESRSTRVSFTRYMQDRWGQLSMNYNGNITGVRDFLIEE